MMIRNHMHILMEATPKLPPWMQARAARYIRIRKRCSHRKNRNNMNPETTPVIKLYKNAVNSAGFIVVACHVLGLNIWSHTKSFDNLPSFLIEPDKEMDCTHLPKDLLDAGSAKFSFLKCETEAREAYIDSSNGNDDTGKSDKATHQEDNKTSVGNENVTEEQSDAKASAETVSPSHTSQYQGSNVSGSNAILATPLLGWDEILDENECNQEWRDPRMCVLCHTCGDDDADFPSEDNYINPNEDNSSNATEGTTNNNEFELSDVGKCGRLLPFLQSGQTSWVHTGMFLMYFVFRVCLHCIWDNSMCVMEFGSLGE